MTVYKINENIVVSISEEEPVEELVNKIRSLIEGDLGEVLILDFGEAGLIDRTWLAVMVNLWSLCSRKGLKMIICGLNDGSRQIVKAKGMCSFMDIRNDLYESIKEGNEYIDQRHLHKIREQEMETYFGHFGRKNSVSNPSEAFKVRLKEMLKFL